MFRKLLIGVTVLTALVATAFTAVRLMGLSDEQRAALAMMSEPVEFEGENAFDQLWLLAYDVPADEVDAVIEEDVARWQAFIADYHRAQPGSTGTVSAGGGIAGSRPDETVAARRYPLLADLEALGDTLCNANSDCLKNVSENKAAVRGFVETHQPLLDGLARLRSADYLRSPLPSHPVAGLAIPPFELTQAAATWNAYQFSAGKETEALDGACQDYALWRRMGARGDSLITQMIALAYAGRLYGPLVADMMARLPSDWALPASCLQALDAPMEGEQHLCSAMRGEFAFQQASLNDPRFFMVLGNRRFTNAGPSA